MGSFRADLLPSFQDAPHLRPLPQRDGVGPRYQLIRDWYFKDLSGEKWAIKHGYIYDGASIPTLTGLTWAATYSKFDPRVMRAALAHDYFCDCQPAEISSDEAADLFGHMLIEDGAGKWRAAMMVKAVKSFGPHWEGRV
jgi:hypothetical protein